MISQKLEYFTRINSMVMMLTKLDHFKLNFLTNKPQVYLLMFELCNGLFRYYVITYGVAGIDIHQKMTANSDRRRKDSKKLGDDRSCPIQCEKLRNVIQVPQHLTNNFYSCIIANSLTL